MVHHLSGQAIIDVLSRGLCWFLPPGLRRSFLDVLERAEHENTEHAPLLLFRTALTEVISLWRGYLVCVPQAIADAFNPQMVTTRIALPYGPNAVERVEAEFLADHYQLTAAMARLLGPVIIVFNGLWALLDLWCLSETWLIAWSIRAVVCSSMVAGPLLLWRSEDFYQAHYQTIQESLLLVATTGSIIILVLSHPGELGHDIYYAGLMLFPLFAATISGLRADAVLRFCSILVVGYIIMTVVLKWSLSPVEGDVVRLFNDVMFLGSGSFLAMGGAVWLERSFRIRFLIRYVLVFTLEDFVRYFSGNNAVQLQSAINQLQHRPNELWQFLRRTYPAGSGLFLSLPQSLPSLLTASSELKEAIEETDEQDASDILEEVKKPSHSQLFQAAKESLINSWKTLRAWLLSEEQYLFFSDATDARVSYDEDYFYGALTPFRIGAYFAIGTYASFGVVDWVVLPDTRYLSISMRLTFIVIASVLLYVTFFEKVFSRFFVWVVAASVVYASGTIILMIAYANPQELGYRFYYLGLMNILSYIFVFSRLRFVSATLLAIAVVFTYNGINYYAHADFFTEPNMALLMNNNIFLIGGCLAGAIAARYQEWYLRDEFFTRYVLLQKSREILEFQADSKISPQELWDMVSQLRHSPQRIQEMMRTVLSYKDSIQQ
ncbi:hypothetical protein PN498_13315 [Oscillatoria sp. CS-180]|uniref:hypothetical protein n=1 Tax=Oscillatoria sp. CS-180 TaxID=3021720 RepID=UPI00232AAD51|nr:hypothetical protein [Oscillatoria sp. CS-180]MDB9526973.1 hypothetical protein [Oscillatoria sp. CS-180]